MALDDLSRTTRRLHHHETSSIFHKQKKADQYRKFRFASNRAVPSTHSVVSRAYSSSRESSSIIFVLEYSKEFLADRTDGRAVLRPFVAGRLYGM